MLERFPLPVRALLFAAAALVAQSSHATFHLFQIDEIFSDDTGNVQFVELTALAPGQQFLSGHTIAASQGASTNTYTFLTDLPSDTNGKKLLIGTQGFAALGVVTPDFVVPNGFLFRPNGTVTWGGGFDTVSYSSLPTDGVHSIDRSGNVIVNSPTNFAGQTGSIEPLPPPPPPPPPVVDTPSAVPALELEALFGLALVLCAVAIMKLRRSRRR
jgi:hypothetical protein